MTNESELTGSCDEEFYETDANVIKIKDKKSNYENTIFCICSLPFFIFLIHCPLLIPTVFDWPNILNKIKNNDVLDKTEEGHYLIICVWFVHLIFIISCLILSAISNGYFNLKLKKIRKTYRNFNTTIPDEFKDPITRTLIIKPMLLPMNNNIDIFIDEGSIYKCLNMEKRHPFNRQYLDVDDLKKYNELKKNVEKISEFQKKITEWREIELKKQVQFLTSQYLLLT